MPTRVAILFGLFMFAFAMDKPAAQTAIQNYGGFGDPDFLEVDQAFQMSSIVERGSVIVRWQIAPGYYLYKHRLMFSTHSDTDTEPDSIMTFSVPLPEGLSKHDEFFGDVETYYGELEVNFEKNLGNGRFLIQYQGCADAGLCYPPQKRIVGR